MLRVQSAHRMVLTTCALAVGIAGCASASGSGRPAGATSNRIVRAELVPLTQLDLYEAVRLLRSRWLRQRASQTIAGPATPVVVYVDGTRRGGPEELRSFNADQIEELAYMSGIDATTSSP